MVTEAEGPGLCLGLRWGWGPLGDMTLSEWGPEVKCCLDCWWELLGHEPVFREEEDEEEDEEAYDVGHPSLVPFPDFLLVEGQSGSCCAGVKDPLLALPMGATGVRGLLMGGGPLSGGPWSGGISPLLCCDRGVGWEGAE